jgi:hypothetical protein
LRKRLSRLNLIEFVSNLNQCSVAIEAYMGAHYRSRLFKSMGHTVKMMPPQFVQEVARQFKSTWHHVFTAVSMAVAWGRERMELTGISAIGVDVIHWAKNSFMTLVYQIDNHCKRLLWCGEKGRKKQLTISLNGLVSHVTYD